ncbi:MAG TPA: hypothetical protein VEQ67_15340 [Mycobacterium sp.]|nr:hypothetical protein [Mycobacterium sp.]
MAGTGIGGTITLANSGVTTEGPVSGAAEVVVEFFGAEGVSVDDVHETVSAAIAKSAAKFRLRPRMISFLLLGLGLGLV